VRKVCLISAQAGRDTPCWFDCGTVCKRRLAGIKRPSAFPGLSFELPLSDSGSGAVSTALLTGAGAATFTRATTATTRDSAGTLVSVASGTPRSYYLSDGTYAGYLAEGARTNLAIRSEEIDHAAWVKTDITVTPDDAVAPDGATTADLLTEGTAGTATFSNASVPTVADASTITCSVFIKRSAVVQWVFIRAANTVGTNGVRAWFDIQNGTKGAATAFGSGTGASSTMESWGNGWYRCAATVTLAAGDTTARFNLNSASTNGITTRLNNSAYWVWGVQTEVGAFASSYIPTTTASVTRNADVLTYTFAGNADATQGACYAELSLLTQGAPAASIWFVGFGSGIGPLRIGGSAATTTIGTNDGTNLANKTGLTDLTTGVRKRAASWGTNQAVTGDGATVATAVFDGDIGSLAVSIGCTPGGAAQAFGTIKNVRIWKDNLSNNQLVDLTRY
jgi:hypothetical protein